MDPSFWGQRIAPGDECRSWRIGRSLIRARTDADEWELAVEYGSDDEPLADTGCSDELEWTRYVTVAQDELTLTPALPDRPVVVRPATPIVILPGRWGRFFFRVPLWARFISHRGERESVMEEIPTRKLGSTWFGDIATGELCYVVEAPLERRLEQLVMGDAFAACEVSVRNNSRERLRFERICVHVEHMRLYRTTQRLWTNEVRVSFRGADQVSQLSFTSGPPERAGVSEEVAEPRVPPESGLIKRSFALIREIAGM